MSPHHDAPSPANSYSQDTDFHHSVQSVYTMSQYNNFDTSSMESTDMGIRRSLVPGIYVPTVAFFEPSSDNVDVETTASHAVRLAKAGVAGITTQGSNGEAVHLSHKERDLITTCCLNFLEGFHQRVFPGRSHRFAHSNSHLQLPRCSLWTGSQLRCYHRIGSAPEHRWLQVDLWQHREAQPHRRSNTCCHCLRSWIRLHVHGRLCRFHPADTDRRRIWHHWRHGKHCSIAIVGRQTFVWERQ